ncbi:MAG: phosphoribosylanthranilate isomerase [Verrucomicrobia bacterium]|nr:phosphoribosylanthranilate isomerase [Verrucomicrobiota bacterium]
MSIKVKICGITNPGDAEAAVAAGADLLGLVFHDPSPRRVSLEQAAEVCRVIPPYVVRVGLFVNPAPERVTEVIARCGLQMLQFHGDETPGFCLQFGLMTLKAFRIQGPKTLEDLPPYATDAWLLDAHVPGKFGGTGQTFDWAIAAQAAQLGKPVFLAGGLTPDNVGEAVRRVQPYGVDVSGGVEAAPGRKDHAKVRAFIEAARQAARAVGPKPG